MTILVAIIDFKLSEGSATLTIANEEKLMVPQKAGKELAIICDLDLINVRQHFMFTNSMGLIKNHYSL